MFTADAGVGKTRLAAEVARVAFGSSATGVDGAGGGARVLSVRCAAYGERWRLGPLADLVRAAIGLPDQPSVAVTRLVAEERLRRVGHIVERRTGVAPRLQIEQLLALLGYADPPMDRDLRPDRTAPNRGIDEATANRYPGAVAELISSLADDAPVVVVVDDLQDASPATVDALGATLNRLVGPVLVVLLGRPELVRSAGALTRLSDAEVHPMAPLRGAEMARLLTAYLGGGRLPGPETDRLLATAQGNPFYLSELVTLLIERGALTREATAKRDERTPANPIREREERASASPAVASKRDAVASQRGNLWHLAAGSLAGRLLSRDLAAVLAARIDALPPDSRAVLRDAAVVGDTVPLAALLAARDHRSGADTRPTAVASVALDRALDELLHRRLLLTTRGGYVFATPLLREAAYAGVGKADLAERHAHLTRWAVGLAVAPELATAGLGSAHSSRFAVPAELATAGLAGAHSSRFAAPAELATAGLAGAHSSRFAVPGPSLGWTAETVDAFIAEQAERAANQADAVSLRPEAPARAVAPLGVDALGRLARRAIQAGEPAQAAHFGQRALALARGELPNADRLVLASALVQLGRAPQALIDIKAILATSADDPVSRARALLLAGRAYRMIGDTERGDQILGRGAAGGDHG